MKKIFLIVLLLSLSTGCVPIEKTSIDDLTNEVLNSKYPLYNHVMRGYKYYLPRNLASSKIDELNEVLKSKHYDYYLYVDLVSFYNNIANDFQEDSSLYYSHIINYNDKLGIINITKIDDVYLIEVVYNYAKIEVKVNESDIKTALVNALTIVSTIDYNKDVIESMMSEDILSSAEEQVNIFEKENTGNNSLDVDENFDDEDEEFYDPDVIR